MDTRSTPWKPYIPCIQVVRILGILLGNIMLSIQEVRILGVFVQIVALKVDFPDV